MSLFGTNGIRGIVGETMNPDLAMRLGRAVGTWLPEGSSVAIGTDARLSRDMLKQALAAGIHSAGVHTVDVGIAASPAIQLYVRDKKFAAGAIITASHNPPEYNGIKLVAPDGTETSQSEEAAVEAIMASGTFRTVAWDKVGTHTAADATEHYIQAVMAQVDAEAIRKAGLKVVLDLGGGAGCATAPVMLERLGVEVVPLACAFDPHFSSRPSEPTPQNAAACIAAVKEHKADLGILQDGDADRAVFIDEQGGYVWGDTTLALACLHELKRHPQGSTVCTAVSSSSCVADAVNMAGGKLEWTVVGSPVVAREMIRLGAVFGGEDNGGLMFTRHQVCRDGLMAMAFMLELVATTGKPFSELVAAIPRYALVKEKLAVPDDQKSAVLMAFQQKMEGMDGVKDVDARDGVKVYLENGWVLVRPSGTEPIFRVQGEAQDLVTAQEIVSRFKALLESVV